VASLLTKDVLINSRLSIGGGLDYNDGLGGYRPHITLVTSPDHFIALIPACDAVTLAQKIQREYEKQFSKVRNRLPLHLGLVYFPRKMPLFAVLDAGRRMSGAEQATEVWRIRKRDTLPDHSVVCFDNGAAWKVNTKMGDGRTDDDWYPYWRVTRAAGGQVWQKHFQIGNEDWVHVSELQTGDKVTVHPSHFSFIFLDASTRRFEAGNARYTWLLDDLPWLDQTGQAILDQVAATQLHAVEGLLKTRWESWGKKDGETFGRFATAVLRNTRIDNLVTPDDVISGRFFRLLELYLHILR